VPYTLGNCGSIPAELNINFAVTQSNLSRDVKKDDFNIALQGMLHQAICPMQLAINANSRGFCFPETSAEKPWLSCSKSKEKNLAKFFFFLSRPLSAGLPPLPPSHRTL
jgi:hypothetical protein